MGFIMLCIRSTCLDKLLKNKQSQFLSQQNSDKTFLQTVMTFGTFLYRYTYACTHTHTLFCVTVCLTRAVPDDTLPLLQLINLLRTCFIPFPLRLLAASFFSHSCAGRQWVPSLSLSLPYCFYNVLFPQCYWMQADASTFHQELIHHVTASSLLLVKVSPCHKIA